MASSDGAWTTSAGFDIPGLVHGVWSLPSTHSGASREQARAVLRDRLTAHGETFWLHQVHGVALAVVPWSDPPDADGAIVSNAGHIAVVETADCLPVLLCDPDAHLAAAVHAGWRGTAQGIARQAVAGMVARGASRHRLRALLGPAIGVCCYAVGSELREQFPPEASRYFVGPHPHLDLRGVNVAQLLAAGVGPDRIAHIDECTACTPGSYPSYRRDGRGCGRLFSFVGWER